MREALRRARKGPLRRVHNVEHGKPPWPAPAASLAALVKRALLVKDVRKTKAGDKLEEWTITDDGIEALKPPPVKVRQARPVFLTAKPQHVKADYTSDPTRAMNGEPEAVSPADLDSAWFGAAMKRHTEARDRRERAREIAARRKAA